MNNIKTLTPVNNLVIVVRSETGRDLIAKRIVYRRVLNADADENQLEQAVAFAAAVTQTVEIRGELGFPWPTVSASADELKAALECFLDLPSNLFRVWIDGIEEVNAPSGDPDLLPESELDAKKNKTPA